MLGYKRLTYSINLTHLNSLSNHSYINNITSTNCHTQTILYEGQGQSLSHTKLHPTSSKEQKI